MTCRFDARSGLWLPEDLWTPPSVCSLRAYPGLVAAGVRRFVSFRTSAVQGAGGTSISFPSQDIGNPAPNRHVIVAATVLDDSINQNTTITGLTIVGAAATEIFKITANPNAVAFWGLLVTAGTTATIAYSASGTSGAAGWGIAVWAAYGLASLTAVATAQSSAHPASLNVNVAAGDFVFAAARCYSTASMTWTGVTEEWDTSIGGGGLWSGGHHDAVAAEAPRTVTGTYATDPAFSKRGACIVLR